MLVWFLFLIDWTHSGFSILHRSIPLVYIHGYSYLTTLWLCFKFKSIVLIVPYCAISIFSQSVELSIFLSLILLRCIIWFNLFRFVKISNMNRPWIGRIWIAPHGMRGVWIKFMNFLYQKMLHNNTTSIAAPILGKKNRNHWICQWLRFYK